LKGGKMTIKNRIKQLEKQKRQDPETIEVYIVYDDGAMLNGVKMTRAEYEARPQNGKVITITQKTVQDGY
jgi:hypothetical protein